MSYEARLKSPRRSRDKFSAVGTLTNSESLYIGRRSPATTYWVHGLIDEVRVSKSARSADWIRASHACVADAFMQFGPVLINTDLDGDHQVTFADLATLLNYWLQRGDDLPADFFPDGQINLQDFAITAQYWQ